MGRHLLDTVVLGGSSVSMPCGWNTYSGWSSPRWRARLAKLSAVMRNGDTTKNGRIDAVRLYRDQRGPVGAPASPRKHLGEARHGRRLEQPCQRIRLARRAPRCSAKTRIARREWPPRSKKLSWRSMSVVPRTSCQMAAMVVSMPGRGGSRVWRVGCGWAVGRRVAVDLLVGGEREACRGRRRWWGPCRSGRCGSQAARGVRSVGRLVRRGCSRR